MKISTEIKSAAVHVGEEKAVIYCAQAGFDHWDFSMGRIVKWSAKTQQVTLLDHPLTGPNYVAFARHLKQVGLDNGITCNQSHAPYPVKVPQIRSLLKRTIECTAEAGGKICIIHPDNDASPEENAEFYWELLPFAKEHGVKIATENMWNWNVDKTFPIGAACSNPESFVAHVDAVNDPSLVACLDIGHAELRGMETSAVAMIEALGSRLQALHIHDTDLVNDSHQIPFSMNIDFPPIVKALKKIQYQGEFTLEAVNYLKAYTPDTLLDGMKQLAASARRLADLFESE